MNEDLHYNQSLKQYDTIVSAMTCISQGAADRKSETSKHFYASVLFTRLCTLGISLLLGLPNNRLTKADFDHWDFSTVASQARNIIECYFAFYYLCVEDVPIDEWDCRWNLFNLHDCTRRQKMFDYLEGQRKDVTDFTSHVEDLRSRLLNNKYFCALSEKRQKYFLKAESAYLINQDELLKRIGFDSTFFRGMYIFLSSHIHSYPLSYYRMEEHNSGRGLENRTEKRYISSALEFVCVFVQKSAKEMITLFPESDEKLSVEGQKAIFETDLLLET